MDGTQDWDLFLRLAERTSAMLRIPKVLYHWRQVLDVSSRVARGKAVRLRKGS